MATTTLTGTTGNDILNAPGSVTTLVAGLQGNDTITLILAGDEADAGAGNDSIVLNGTGTIANTVNGGSGNDSVQAPNATLINASINLNDGDDTIRFTAAQLIGGSYGGNAGADLLVLNGGLLNAAVGGGADADSINLQGGLTNVSIFGGGGKDTINLAAGATTLSTIQAGDGHDLIIATAIGGSNSLVLTGGKGFDSINLGATTVGSVAGGALNDTIATYGANAFGGGVVYGDAIGATTGSSDGNDLIRFTGAAIAAATSIYGAGGNDSIYTTGFAAASALVIQGNDGADLISNTASDAFAAATVANIAGGDGHDTIAFLGTGTVSATILGGDGADSIYIGSNGGLGTINGGAGADTIQWVGASPAATNYAAIGTINGGDGADVILAGNGLSGISYSAISAGGGTTAMVGAVANVTYQSGDVVRFNTTAANTAAMNVLNTIPAIYVSNATAISAVPTGGDNTNALVYGTVTGGANSAGSIAVFDTNGLGVGGGDLLIAVYSGASSLNQFVRVVGGDSLITTTAAGIVSVTNVNLTFASSNGNVSVTLG